MANSRGDRLVSIRKKLYKSADAAATEMRRAGYKMTKSQLARIESGQWPSEYQLLSLCEFFEVTPEFLLFGSSCPLDTLSPSVRRIAENIIKELADIDSPPPLLKTNF